MSDDPFPPGSIRFAPHYHLTLKIEEDYLLARVTGRRSAAAVSALVTEIAGAAIEHRREKVLIDVRELKGRLSITDSYLVVTRDFRRFRGKGIKKAAIVDRPPPELREWFLELVARNRGFNLRIFKNSTAALKWLLGPKADEQVRNNSVEST